VPRLYFALDLKDDAALIAEYERWHRAERIWPEVVVGLSAAGVTELEIFRCGNRLVMVMDAPRSLAAADQAAPAIGRAAQWEELMWRFQQSLPFAEPGQKWVPMQRIFSLTETRREQGR
jgi:L-rhamnose mutarotase